MILLWGLVISISEFYRAHRAIVRGYLDVPVLGISEGIPDHPVSFPTLKNSF